MVVVLYLERAVNCSSNSRCNSCCGGGNSSSDGGKQL